MKFDNYESRFYAQVMRLKIVIKKDMLKMEFILESK